MPPPTYNHGRHAAFPLESFLYPIVSQALTLRDEDAAPGISAVIVYPMNALAEDQLMRLRGLLAGTGIPFGIFTGRTPERQAQVVGGQLPAGSSRADYHARLARARQESTGETIYPAEEVCSREVMRTPGRQPRILLTNVKQLELLLTRQQDIELFADAPLDYLVFDEAHTFTGALGAETAVLIRRLRAFCNVEPAATRCVATSATIVDREDPHFPATTCTTCGQHYFIAHLKDFSFTGSALSGGDAGADGTYWEALAENQGGKRLVLVDRLIGASDDEDAPPHARTAPLHFCRHCGTAHPDSVSRCRHCGETSPTVRLWAVKQNKNNPGLLTSCLSCGALGGRRAGGHYREPAREVRAINVADVHVLTQDMVHHAQRQRLLVFCDNRQDAAFQAGWMKDHARRFRLRALMADGIQAGHRSVGDLTAYLDDLMEDDETLSRALLPEVWAVARHEGGGGRHEQERRKYLRFQVLREVALSSRQALGLEPWGRLKVEYDGLDATLPWIQQHAHALGVSPEKLREGVASVLDYLRRQRILHDPEHEIFTRYWMEGNREIQQGYVPSFLSPTATKLRRATNERSELVAQWLSERGDTTMRQIAGKWGAAPDAVEPLLESLFDFLVDARLLSPVRLKGSHGRPVPNIQGVYQVNADKLRLNPNRGVRRCRTCRRTTTRLLPHDRCPAWRCQGVLEWDQENEDNYDLQLLDGAYSMLRPEEHTAMVPNEERERLENLFKGSSDAVNCLVCTPTLELGIDIGQLDSVLMRNVPPLPANYWQRAGRAGRRHRMAVDITYCRPVSHDRAYFDEPTKLLAGRIDPPASTCATTSWSPSTFMPR